MDWRKFFFSFQGRARRMHYWALVALTIPFLIAAVLIDGYSGHEPFHGPGQLVLLIILWPTLAVSARRWHDRDKSAWWILINFIPIVGETWAFIENGCLKGTTGSNRFGPDPLEAAKT